MSELEDAIRRAAKTGRLNHVSLAFSAMNGKWSASYRGVGDRDQRFSDHSDPVNALLSAVTGRKVAEPVAPVQQRTRRKKQEATAPVNFEDLLG